MQMVSHIAATVEALLSAEGSLRQRRMFGGESFLWNEKFAVQITEQRMLLRIDGSRMAEFLAKPGCRQMVHNGRLQKNYVYVDLKG